MRSRTTRTNKERKFDQVVGFKKTGMVVVSKFAVAIFVPRQDAPAIAGAILDVLRTPGARDRVRRHARRRVEHEFSLDTMIESYSRLYSLVLRDS